MLQAKCSVGDHGNGEEARADNAADSLTEANPQVQWVALQSAPVPAAAAAMAADAFSAEEAVQTDAEPAAFSGDASVALPCSPADSCSNVAMSTEEAEAIVIEDKCSCGSYSSFF